MAAVVPDNYVYLDYAATAPLCEEAASAMAPYFAPGPDNIRFGGNANSLHSPGRAAFAALEGARRSIARDLGASRPDEIIFTSGSTESDDTCVIGLFEAYLDARKRAGKPCIHPQFITTEIEHDAVLAPAKRLEAAGVTVVRLAPSKQGFVSVEQLQDALTEDTLLVSVMMANSEVGSIQPIKDLAAAAHAAGALFHTDATQALGKIPVRLYELEVDAASLSAHKVGGPKGIGALFLRSRTPFKPYLLGGGQESGKRSGTQNVAGAVGFAAAVHASVSMQSSEHARLMALRDRLYAELSQIPEIHATVDCAAGDARYLPNIVHVLVDGLESETLILRFDMKGFGVSGGSACSSHSLEPSHVLKALGIDADSALGALRISMGRYTSAEDIDAFLEALPSVIHWNV